MWEMHTMRNEQDGHGGRRYKSAGSSASEAPLPPPPPPPSGFPSTSEDLHAWSIFRQNLNSDFTDSALGSSEKSPMPYGNFHLRESTMQSILNNPKYGPKSELGANMYTYLKFGLPRVLPPNRNGFHRDNSSGYDSTDEENHHHHHRFRNGGLRTARSEDFLNYNHRSSSGHNGHHRHHNGAAHGVNLGTTSSSNRHRNYDSSENKRFKSVSEANLLNVSNQYYHDAGDYYPSKTHHLRSLARSNRASNLGHRATSERDLQNGAFVNRALEEEEEDDDDDDVEEEEEEDEEEEAEFEFDRHHRRKNGPSKAASQLSLSSRKINGVSYRHEAPMLNDKYFPKDHFGGSNLINNEFVDGFKYPHLQVRNLSYEVKIGGGSYARLLDGITLEARGGELLAIMATKQEEGTALCDILSNSYSRWNSRLRGDLLVNGVTLTPSRLEGRVAYVKQDNNFSPDMSVRQTMLFHAFLKEPGTHSRGRDTKGRINALIEDLGLAQVKHTRVKDLTASEKQRLNVACHLLLDTDVVILDQPTRSMDIFDTFFLVEYLRQWAGRGRIVILTLHPPTYEILTMISKVILISTGRTMYYGKRREMLPYFAFIEYPCPAYKNPSDYYLDLVTLDDLSSEAMLESSQRIDQLANAFKRRMEPLSDPGPPGILPPKVKRANFIVQIFGLWIRALIYMYPFNVINWVKMILLSGAMSICIGAIFLGVRWRYWDRLWQADPIFEQDNINDRLGFHYVMMTIGVWPMFLCMITEEWNNKRPVTRDVEDKLYSKFAYIITKTMYSIPSAGGIFLAYIIPGYLLAGLHYPEKQDLNTFYLYIGYMLLYLFSMRMLMIASVNFSSSRHLAASFGGFLSTLLAFASGYVIHSGDLSFWTVWLKYVSPQYWMNHPIQQDEFLPVEVFRCTDNPVITENSIIIKQVPCGLSSGEDAVEYFHFKDKFATPDHGEFSPFVPLVICASFYGIFQILAYVFFLAKRQVSKFSRARKSKL